MGDLSADGGGLNTLAVGKGAAEVGGGGIPRRPSVADAAIVVVIGTLEADGGGGGNGTAGGGFGDCPYP